MKVVTALALMFAVTLTLPAWADEATAGPAAVTLTEQQLDGELLAPGQDGALQQEVADTSAPSPALNSTATAFTHDLTPWGMYQAADWVVKAVMIGLLIASVITWTVWGYKTFQLYVHRRNTGRVLAVVAQADSFAAAKQELAALPIKGDNSAALAMVSATELELGLSARGPASADGIKERVGARLERVLAAGGTHMNRGTGVLATIGSTAPFVGLFGTVWGIMNSFIGIAESQTTNLAVVAPGIAEALLATAIGLVAAIPAVVIYNHFARGIGVYRGDLADIAAALLTLVSRDLDRAGNPA